MTTVSGRLYKDGKLVQGTLTIEDGKIIKIGKGKAEHDFGKQMILPGGIDVHVHFREPGATHKEDFQSGTTAAACGGITTVVDMPNTVPPATSAAALQKKHALVGPKAFVDYGLWGGGSWYTGGVEEMLEQTVGMKIYLGATTGDLLLEDQKAFLEILTICGQKGRPVVLHAEAQRVLHQLRRTEHSLVDHDQARPPLAEVEAIYDVMKVMPRIKKPPTVHICHVASAEAVEAARHAGFSTGVCPHHLLLHTGGFEVHEGYGKMNPPLRSAAARDALWQTFHDGGIPLLESDHAPHTRVEKEGAFHQAPSGVPGVETMLPILLARVEKGEVDLRTVVEAMTTGPARLLGLQDRGSLAVGMKADLAVYGATTAIDPDKLHSKCGWSPYAGMDAVFPTHTMLAGQWIVKDGQPVGGLQGKRL